MVEGAAALPTISIVIPVYNGADYVAAAIRCCLDQSVPPHEVIVVDDGSTDATPQVLARVGDPRLRIVTQANAGISATRNAGVATASGTFVAFLDADDEIEPDTLARYVAALKAHEDVDVLFADYWLSDIPDAQRSAHAALGGIDALPGVGSAMGGAARLGGAFADAYGEHALSQALVHTSAIVIRRSLFGSLGGFDTAMVVGEDYDLWRRGFAAGETAVLTGAPVSIYFKWRGSLEKYAVACRQNIVGLQALLGTAPRFGGEWRRLRRSIANEYLILLYALGVQRTPRRTTVPVLLRSVAAYPLPARQARYAAMMVLPRGIIRLLHRMRAG